MKLCLDTQMQVSLASWVTIILFLMLNLYPGPLLSKCYFLAVPRPLSSSSSPISCIIAVFVDGEWSWETAAGVLIYFADCVYFFYFLRKGERFGLRAFAFESATVSELTGFIPSSELAAIFLSADAREWEDIMSSNEVSSFIFEGEEWLT